TPPPTPAAPTRDYPPLLRTAVTLQWDEVTGADGYRVYAQRGDYGEVSLVYDGMGLGDQLSYTHISLEAGVSYTYWLTALSAASESTRSSPLETVAAELSGPPTEVVSTGPKELRWKYPRDEGGTSVKAFQVLVSSYDTSLSEATVNWTAAQNDWVFDQPPWETTFMKSHEL
ncbi:hypothetical protein Pmar_PMAR022447, partial [Perkinsus marinus ATCC 50983]